MYRAPQYLKWIEQADQLFVIQKKGPIKMLCGEFVPLLELYTTDLRKRKDCDNRLKVPLDYAVRLGLIQDDRFARFGITGWVTNRLPDINEGARLTLYPYKKEGLPEITAALLAKFS